MSSLAPKMDTSRSHRKLAVENLWKPFCSISVTPSDTFSSELSTLSKHFQLRKTNFIEELILFLKHWLFKSFLKAVYMKQLDHTKAIIFELMKSAWFLGLRLPPQFLCQLAGAQSLRATSGLPRTTPCFTPATQTLIQAPKIFPPNFFYQNLSMPLTSFFGNFFIINWQLTNLIY